MTMSAKIHSYALIGGKHKFNQPPWENFNLWPCMLARCCPCTYNVWSQRPRKNKWIQELRPAYASQGKVWPQLGKITITQHPLLSKADKEYWYKISLPAIQKTHGSPRYTTDTKEFPTFKDQKKSKLGQIILLTVKKREKEPPSW